MKGGEIKCLSKGCETLLFVPRVLTKVMRIILNIYNWLNQESMLYSRPQTGFLGWNIGGTTDDTQTVEKAERKSVQLFYFVHVWAVTRYLYLCLVPVKVNKTNCHVPICGCFSRCFEFTSCAVYPTLHVCVGDWFGLTLFSPPPSLPSVLEHARVRGHNNWATLSLFDVVCHTDGCACTHTHTDTNTNQGQVKTNRT